MLIDIGFDLFPTFLPVGQVELNDSAAAVCSC